MTLGPSMMSRPSRPLSLLLAAAWALPAWAGSGSRSNGIGVGITITHSAAATAHDGQLDAVNQDVPVTLSATAAYAGQTFNFGIVTPPTHGVATLIDPAAGTFSYKADARFKGVDSFTFQVVDNHGVASNVATEYLLLHVSSRALEGAISTPPNTPVGDNLPATHSYPAETLTFTVLKSPDVGAFNLTDVHTGAFTYSPPTGFTGSVIIKFRVMDPAGRISNIAVERITVTPEPPTAIAGSVSTHRNHAVSGTLSGAIAFTGQMLSFRLAKQAVHGKVVITDFATGAFIYTPARGYHGPDRFKFRVTDQSGTHSNAAIESITVQR